MPNWARRKEAAAHLLRTLAIDRDLNGDPINASRYHFSYLHGSLHMVVHSNLQRQPSNLGNKCQLWAAVAWDAALPVLGRRIDY